MVGCVWKVRKVVGVRIIVGKKKCKWIYKVEIESWKCKEEYIYICDMCFLYKIDIGV